MDAGRLEGRHGSGVQSLQVLDGHGRVGLGFYGRCYSLSHGSYFRPDMSYNIQRGLIILIAALRAEVHEQVDGIAHAGGVLGRLEDGLVFRMLLAARFLGRHGVFFLSYVCYRRFGCARFLPGNLGSSQEAARGGPHDSRRWKSSPNKLHELSSEL
jgi:hypothetical protein